MKKKYYFQIIIVIILLNFCFSNIFIYETVKIKEKHFTNFRETQALNINNDRQYTFTYQDKTFIFSRNKILKNNNITEFQKRINTDNMFYNKSLKLLKNYGLSKKEIVRYMFPEIEIIKNKLCEIINIDAEENYIELEKNTCNIKYIYGKDGLFLSEEDFYNKIYKNVENNSKEIFVEIKAEHYSDKNNSKDEFKEKGYFSTNYSSSSPARKNNIKTALAVFDGILLEEGEILSFNKTTGVRNEENGYQKAKIISSGTFIDGYGGGVCQVSTTLYNACLIAGLEILEVHNHSLPVSYIEPSFDAMVNVGSSDLIIRNNTNGKILITTSSKNDKCMVKIYGKENKYKIERISKKTKIIPASGDVIETDYLKYGEIDLEIGEEKRISYSKDGLYSKGYLNYYDRKGVLIKTELIRENRYNATKGVIIKREK